MVSSTEDGDITRRLGEDANVAITNQYLDDITDATVQPGEAPVEFQDVYDQAKVVHDLAEAEGNYVVFGDPYEEPMYAKIEDEEVIDQVWQDEQGEFDNFAQVYDELDAQSAS
jgi:hypothetical protein